MKISLIQMNSQPDRDHNLRQALRLMQDAVDRDAPDLIVLPEHFDWSGGTPQQKSNAADAVPGGRAYDVLQDFAASHRVWLHAGSLLERVQGSDRIRNTTVIFDADGIEVGRYRKLHLFDIVAPDGKTYRESETVERGNDLLIYEINGLRIGCAICYDLRFSRLFDRPGASGRGCHHSAGSLLRFRQERITGRFSAGRGLSSFRSISSLVASGAPTREPEEKRGRPMETRWSAIHGGRSSAGHQTPSGFSPHIWRLTASGRFAIFIPMETHRLDLTNVPVRSALP